MNYPLQLLEKALRTAQAVGEQTTVTELRTALAILHLFDTAVFVHATE